MFGKLGKHAVSVAVLSLGALSCPAQQSSPAPAPAQPQPAWRAKPIPAWNADDAKELLANSPWIKFATPEFVRDLSPGERRDSGDWDADIGKGVGIAGTGLLGSAAAEEAIERAHYKPPVPPVAIRWESALPVRVAEQKAGETDVPVLSGDDYALVIYGIQVPDRWRIAAELKGVSFLRRTNKKDLHPSRVDIIRHGDGTANLVYLFPRSVEITRKDGPVEFVAQVGRLFVTQYFQPEQMQYQGELQLLLPSSGLR